MNQANAFGTLLIVMLFLAVGLVIDWAGKKPQIEIEQCNETDQIQSTSDYVITYCKDNGKVWRDSTWSQPTNYEKRWIEWKKRN